MESSRFLWVVLAMVAAGSACRDDDDFDDAITPESVLATESAGVPFPPTNVPNAEKIALGQLLFWDPVLSGDQDVACATCHDPAAGYSDGRVVSIGTGNRVARRNALTVLDAAWNGWTASNPFPDASTAPMFWDNRAQSFEGQALGPLTAENEMRGEHFSETTIVVEVLRRVASIPAYVTRFDAAFGSATVTEDALLQAISAFERTLVTVPSYQRFLAGDDSAMTAQQQHGRDVFRQSGCSRCHAGPMLSDFALHRFSRSGEAIRTPSLRNVLLTAPYMHDGRAATLDAVFEIYRNVDRRADDRFDDLHVPRDGDRADVIRFLEAASDGTYDTKIPDSVPSGLPVGRAQR